MLRAAFTSALARYPQVTHRSPAWLLRFSGAQYPQDEQVCDVYAAGTFSTRPPALWLRRVTSRPQALARMPRLKPAFCRTHVPGSSGVVPRAERVTRYDFTPTGTARDQRNRTHPTFGTHTRPILRLSRRMCPGLTATCRNPSSRSAFRQDGLRCVPPKKFRIAWAKSRNACCRPVTLPARSHANSALASVNCRACSAKPGAAPRPGRQCVCCSHARFQTNRACAQCSNWNPNDAAPPRSGADRRNGARAGPGPGRP